jgi:hypothetical protein
VWLFSEAVGVSFLDCLGRFEGRGMGSSSSSSKREGVLRIRDEDREAVLDVSCLCASSIELGRRSGWLGFGWDRFRAIGVDGIMDAVDGTGE